MAKISKEIKRMIMKMVKNISQWATGKELRISRSSISEILLKFQGTRSVFGSTKMWLLLKAAAQVTDECDLFNLMSVDTIKCIHQEHELKGCISAKKLAITKKHLKAR